MLYTWHCEVEVCPDLQEYLDDSPEPSTSSASSVLRSWAFAASSSSRLEVTFEVFSGSGLLGGPTGTNAGRSGTESDDRSLTATFLGACDTLAASILLLASIGTCKGSSGSSGTSPAVSASVAAAAICACFSRSISNKSDMPLDLRRGTRITAPVACLGREVVSAAEGASGAASAVLPSSASARARRCKFATAEADCC